MTNWPRRKHRVPPKTRPGPDEQGQPRYPLVRTTAPITSNFGEDVEHGPYFRKIKLQSRMGYLYLIRRARDELSGIKECWERAIQAP